MEKPEAFPADSGLVGSSLPMRTLYSLVAAIGPADLPVLITGEMGTGKQLLVREIHRNSPRRDRPFVQLNLAAIPSTLAESELFGYVRGAFTGAVSNKIGRWEAANGGTLYLDELEDAPKDLQGLILRVIETGAVVPLGSSQERQVDVRVIASSISELSQLLRGSTVRSDLVNRLASSVIRVPPLRERTDDIPELTDYFLSRIGARLGRRVEISGGARSALQGYDFPGNVRELASIIERAAILSQNGLVDVQALGLEERRYRVPADAEALRQELDQTRQMLDAVRSATISANPIWDGRSFPTEEDYCFVLMPFADLADVQRVYSDHVKPVLEQRCGLRCQRADDIYDISGVMQSVWEGINRARLIIADLTGRNPNVFYELGIAHTLGKPVIMLTQSMEFVPFDLRHLRCIVYEYKPKEIGRMEASLERTVRTVLSLSSGVALSLGQDGRASGER